MANESHKIAIVLSEFLLRNSLIELKVFVEAKFEFILTLFNVLLALPLGIVLVTAD